MLQNKEAQVASDVAQKLLEVQKDKHQSLRTGYTGLYSATMSRLKKHVEVQEKMRELVNAFPNVVARNEDGTYEFEPCAQNQEQDVWWQGEQLHKMLRDIKGQHDEEKRVIQKQVTPPPRPSGFPSTRRHPCRIIFVCFCPLIPSPPFSGAPLISSTAHCKAGRTPQAEPADGR